MASDPRAAAVAEIIPMTENVGAEQQPGSIKVTGDKVHSNNLI